MAPKRKRAGTLSKDAPDAEPTRPTSRASTLRSDIKVDGEAANDVESSDPPAKRTRAASSATNTSKKTAPKEDYTIKTGGKVEMPNYAAPESGENGEAGSMRMEPPPKAGTVEPAGYHTNPPPEGRPVRVYADGVFDLFHLGHMRVLQQAKCAFPDTYLIVGVTGDTETHKRKGLTVMSGKERAESLRHCRWVDEVVEDCPWIITVDFLEKHQIDYVAHDDLPYGASEGDDIYKPIKERGQFLVTQRTEGVSTTGIITKIVRDYEQYIKRQLQRGTSRQELNVSWLKKNEIDLKRHVAELRDTIRTNWTTTGQELSKEFRQFWQPSRASSPSSASMRNGSSGSGLRSPLPWDRASRHAESIRGDTPSKGRGGNTADFAAGYAMGLIGGVKGWMEGGSRRRNLSDQDGSRAQSPGSDQDQDHSSDQSPVEEEPEAARGRKRGGEGEKAVV
jgi:choline-phosphate cytidylyltransferase